MLSKGFLAMAQQLLKHIFTGITSTHFAKFNHLATTNLVATSWFCDSSKNFLLFFFSILDLAAEYFLLYMAFYEYIADQKYLPVPLNRTGFQLQWGFPLLGILALSFPFLTLPPASALLASAFFSLVSSFSVFSPTILKDKKEN